MSSPTIGLATVYNTLRSMTERGLVRELPFNNATRFDVNLTPHANLVCTRCGAIEDSEACNDLLVQLQQRIGADAGFAPEPARRRLRHLRQMPRRGVAGQPHPHAAPTEKESLP